MHAIVYTFRNRKSNAQYMLENPKKEENVKLLSFKRRIYSQVLSFPGVNISTEKRKLFPDNLLKARNFSQGNCDLLKGTSINEVTFGVFLNPFPSPPL